MALIVNGTTIPSSGSVSFNSTSLKVVNFGNTQVWKREAPAGIPTYWIDGSKQATGNTSWVGNLGTGGGGFSISGAWVQSWNTKGLPCWYMNNSGISGFSWNPGAYTLYYCVSYSTGGANNWFLTRTGLAIALIGSQYEGIQMWCPNYMNMAGAKSIGNNMIYAVRKTAAWANVEMWSSGYLGAYNSAPSNDQALQVSLFNELSGGNYGTVNEVLYYGTGHSDAQIIETYQYLAEKWR